jgi:uncharacterized OB-fold protein
MTELTICRCTACGYWTWPPRLLCPACGAATAECVAAGPGVVNERTDTATPAGHPVALVSVVLDAGPWVIARTREAGPGDVVRLTVADDLAVEAVRVHEPGDP